MKDYTNQLINHWDGWTIKTDEPIILDPEGNHYHLHEIRAIFFTRQFMETMVGSHLSRTVVTMKEHLQSKIDAVETPVITIDWGDGMQEQIRHPNYG